MFLDKRDEKGQLLSFKAFLLSEEIAELGVQKFIKSKIYEELIRVLPKNLTILLYKKLIFEEVFKTSCKIIISSLDNEKKVDTDFDLISLLQEKKSLSNFYFFKKKKKIFKLQNLSKKIRDFVWKNYTKICFVRNFYRIVKTNKT